MSKQNSCNLVCKQIEMNAVSMVIMRLKKISHSVFSLLAQSLCTFSLSLFCIPKVI